MKIKFIQTRGNKKNKKSGEIGQALLLVLVLLLVGILIITSSLAFIGTSLNTNVLYIKNTNDLYAAEAGVQDGENNVLYQTFSGLQTLFSTPANNIYTNQPYNNPPYANYDYTDSWYYNLPNQVNNDSVMVKISEVWVPLIDANTPGWFPTANKPLPPDGVITPPSQSEAASIINNTNLVVSGGVPNPGTKIYKVNITYKGGAVSLPIISIGVWLPQGFTYNVGTSSLTGIYSTEQLLKCAGNEAVVWSFPSGTTFSGLAGTNNITISITFAYSTTLTSVPNALSWVVDGGNTLLPYAYTWDANINDYDIISDAGNTQIEANVPTSSLRTLGAAINGDYVAIGNSLMIMYPKTQSNDPYGIRYTATQSGDYTSRATVAANSNKLNSTIVGAYLYWSGWLNSSSETMGSSYGENVNLQISSGASIIGTTALSCSDPQTKANGATYNGDYSYSCEVDVTTLVQGELQTAGLSIFSNPLTFAVCPASGCKLGDTGNEWSYTGWSLILIYRNPSTYGHQLYIYDTFVYADNDTDIDPTGTTNGPGGTISGFIVPSQQDPGTQDTNPQGANYVPEATLTAFVGEGDWCYSGDFLAFNAPSSYSSNPQSIPNSYKLWDGLNLPSIGDTQASPNNVWNSYSQTGLSDGVDIKTFTITWESHLLQPGANSARLDMPTQTDSWNLVYMILSFRSSVTTGGPISYLITHR